MNSDKKKRLIIPVATLMVAIVMMAGVGYAAISQSIFKTTDESIGIGGLELNVEYASGTSNKLFKDVKIPYAVNTTDGIKEYVILEDDYVLAERNITITDNTGLYTKYKIEATAETSSTIPTSCELICKITQNTTEITGEFTDTSNLKLSVILKVSGDVKTGDLSEINKLTLNNIEIIVTLTGVA